MTTKNHLKHGIDDDITGVSLWTYALQHLVFFTAGTVILPVAVGLALGLSHTEIVELLQRTFLLSGIMSLVQIKFGHRFPIIDASAGLWASMLIIMAVSAVQIGKPLPELVRNLEAGILIAGLLIILLVITGVIRQVAKLFTPLINGIVILLMVLQMSKTIVYGMLGITGTNSTMQAGTAAIFLLTALLILLVSIYAKRFVQSIATLVGVTVGWIVAGLVGAWSLPSFSAQILCAPKPFAWGAPSFDLGITLNCIISSMLLLSMTFASVYSMGEAVQEQVDEKRVNRSILLHGVATVLSGIFPIVPFMPFASSTGVVLMTGVAARKPFQLACLIMITFGVLAPVSGFLASMPISVAYASTIVVFSLIFGQGLKEFRKMTIGNRESYVIGISITLGVGFMFLPKEALVSVPDTLRMILSNGLVVGTIVAFVLDPMLRLGKKEENHG